MERIRVHGGARLVGEVGVPGAKNSVLKLMAATLLAPGRSTLHDVPDIVDVRVMAELLRRLGCHVEHSRRADDRADDRAGDRAGDRVDTVVIDVPERPGHRADYELVRAMRASISVLGPLVARTGAADVALPGGDAIGSRGLDLHADGLRALGADVHVDHGYLVAHAPGGLTGTHVDLAFPSVGATENLLTAAVLARGATVIDNVAREPEVVDLADALVAMGARIEGIGTSRLVVTGVAALTPLTRHVVPDRVVAGTWAFAAALTGGDVHVRGARPDHLRAVVEWLDRVGAGVETTAQGLRVTGPERCDAADVATLPFPGFPTDLQPFAITLLSVARGSALVTENLFESRFRFAHELARLGADLRIDGQHVLVRGRDRLSGAPVESPDIRAGAALVVAGLVADGVTDVGGVEHIDRGYSGFVDSLVRLGGAVERYTGPDGHRRF